VVVVSDAGQVGEPAEIVVYWRPGCMFCASLSRQFTRHRVPHVAIDIWSDPAASALVRSVANGNETVPTVLVGAVPLVNPSIHDVLAVALEHVPDAVPDEYEPPQPGRFARWLHGKLSDTPSDPDRRG
jgi:mycoredoxin